MYFLLWNKADGGAQSRVPLHKATVHNACKQTDWMSVWLRKAVVRATVSVWVLLSTQVSLQSAGDQALSIVEHSTGHKLSALLHFVSYIEYM